VKQTTDALSPFIVIFWRGAVGTLIILILSRFNIRNLLGVNKPILIIRGFTGCVALTLFFFSIKYTSLSNAVGIFHTYPLFTTIIGMLFFKERWRRVYIIALLCALGGVLLVVRPNIDFIGTGELLSMSSVIFVGLIINLIRYLRQSDSVFSIIFYFTLITSIISIFPAGIGTIIGSLSQWPRLFLVGLLTTLAQLLLTAGYTYCSAAGGSIVSLLGLPFTFVLSNSFLGEKLSFFLIGGSFLILLSGSLIAFSKRRNNMK
jgi:drug/metabolite transporter (DMT)-like permease